MRVKSSVAEATVRIGEFARATGISERLLRYYEEQGLLRPARAGNGYRTYTQADTRAVRHIRSLLASGLGTGVIAKILPCVGDADDRIVPTCPDVIAELRRERARILESISQLRASADLLDTVLTAASAELAAPSLASSSLASSTAP